jgi:uncharacterized radical SAM superfamily Fe-S cluster-containing enzyme
MNILRETMSLCPECLEFLKATVFEENNKVWIKKECEKHGEFLDLYYGDFELYKKAEKFAKDGKGVSNPITTLKKRCPEDCGLCNVHKSHTALGNIVVTNRCDLQCWYCFFYAKKMGYVYEPSLEQIRKMLRSMRQEEPVPANAVQLTGGEPASREDIVDIIKIAKEEGYDHVQLNTNGIRLANDPEFAKQVRDAGSNTVYMSFDGTTEKTNPKNHWEIQKALDNCKKVNLGVVLVPTIINTVNDHDVGNILKFAIKNIDVVRGVNFQPVSLVGRITKADLKKLRITIPDVIKRIEEQTNGEIIKDDFYPVPTVMSLTKFIESLSGKSEYALSTHFACGMATYVFLDGDKIVPLPRFVDVEGLMKYLNEKTEELNSGKSKVLTSLKVLSKIGSFVDKEKQPKDLNLTKILIDIFKKRDYNALGELHHKSLFIGMMHFMDLYNYDIERVKRCCIHYAQPDGTIVPFCAFNVIPQWYRDKIQEKFSLPIKEWEKKKGKKLEDDFYIRSSK